MLEQLAKAYSPIETRPSSILILVRFLQSLKAEFPMVVTLFERDMLVKLEHPAKAFSLTETVLDSIIYINYEGSDQRPFQPYQMH